MIFEFLKSNFIFQIRLGKSGGSVPFSSPSKETLAGPTVQNRENACVLFLSYKIRDFVQFLNNSHGYVIII